MGRLVSLALAILAVVLAGPALAQSKVALVVGVSDYKVGGKLPQTLADAEKVAGSLASVGFSVERLAVPALSKGALEDALLAFGERAARADVAVLYFAGHGMQHGDDNWLIPASATLRSEAAIRLEGVALQDIMELMKPARFRIIILDACRNNPFRVNWPQTMSGPDGLGAVPKAAMPVGSLIAFSAGAGQKVPNDGVYADALSRLIREGQGLELNQLMRRVRSEVQRKTPAAAPEYIPNYEGSFSFSGGYNPDAGLTSGYESATWNITRRADNLAAYQGYLEAFPDGPNATMARSRIAELGRSTGGPSAPVLTGPAPIPENSQSQAANALAAYTVEPFVPTSPITIQGPGVRVRAEPYSGQTPVLSSGSTGVQLNVVGIARMPDWNWYQVLLRNGQKGFVRSDLTSAPSKGY